MANNFDKRKYTRKGLTEARIEEIKECFDLFNLTGSGTITPKELRDSMLSLGYEAKNQTVYQIISSLDSNGSGSIDFDEFVGMMTAEGNHDTKDDIEKVFRLFDTQKTGKISLHNLRRICRELGETIPDDILLDMIDCADINSDGQVSLDEFYKILTLNKFP